jgi:hypothetical protein
VHICERILDDWDWDTKLSYQLQILLRQQGTFLTEHRQGEEEMES